MNYAFETLTENLKDLTVSQLNQTKKYIEGIIKTKVSEFSLDYDSRPNCPYCNSSIIKKNGKTNNSVQRYKCLNTKCNKTFSSNTNTFIAGSKKFHNYIYEMIGYTLDGISIRSISSKLNIPITTIWTWRTKIITLLENFIDDKNKLSEVFYIDETFIKINLKGTKKKKMPRRSYKGKRSSVAHRELVCIQTVIDNTKRPIFKITETSKQSIEKLNNFLPPLIKEGSIMVSDGDNSYIGFEETCDIIHERITNYKEKSRNGYSLGPINSLHSSFKFMLSRYRGVSTKRLKGYINLFIIDFVLKQVLNKSEIIDYIYESLLDLNEGITNKKIENAEFPINIYGIFEELRQEGLIA